MIAFINKLTGDLMWVADNREDEYKAAGYKPAADAVMPTKEKENGVRTDKRRTSKTNKTTKR